MLRNEDGARTFALRCTAVDTLKVRLPTGIALIPPGPPFCVDTSALEEGITLRSRLKFTRARLFTLQPKARRDWSHTRGAPDLIIDLYAGNT